MSLRSSLKRLDWNPISNFYLEVSMKGTKAKKRRLMENKEMLAEANLPSDFPNESSCGLPLVPVENQACKQTLFDYFCSEVLSNGVLKWRIRDNFFNLVVMNDYGSTDGNMKVRIFFVLLCDA